MRFPNSQIAVFDGARQSIKRFIEQSGECEAAHSDGVDGEEQEPAVGIQKPAAIGDKTG